MRLIDKCKILELFEGLDLTGIVSKDALLYDLRDRYWTADEDDIITYLKEEELLYLAVTSKVIRNEFSKHILCQAFTQTDEVIAIFDSALYVNNILDLIPIEG